MTMVKTLVALATERMLLKTSGPTFLRGIEFMYAAGLAPDRLSVMMTSSHKFVLQFHSKCDIRPFAANYPNFARVLRGIVHVRAWRIKSIEFVNVAFHMRDVENLERAIEKLGVELVLLRNCTYPGVNRGEEAVKFLSALNRKKQAVVCEYGDDRLKHRIARRSNTNRVRRPSRLIQDAAFARLNADNNERGGDANPNAAAIPAVAVPPPPPPAPAQIPAGILPVGQLPPHNNYQERFDPQVVALALQLLNDQQAQLHGILQAQRVTAARQAMARQAMNREYDAQRNDVRGQQQNNEDPNAHQGPLEQNPAQNNAVQNPSAEDLAAPQPLPRGGAADLIERMRVIAAARRGVVQQVVAAAHNPNMEGWEMLRRFGQPRNGGNEFADFGDEPNEAPNAGPPQEDEDVDGESEGDEAEDQDREDVDEVEMELDSDDVPVERRVDAGDMEEGGADEQEYEEEDEEDDEMVDRAAEEVDGNNGEEEQMAEERLLRDEGGADGDDSRSPQAGLVP